MNLERMFVVETYVGNSWILEFRLLAGRFNNSFELQWSISDISWQFSLIAFQTRLGEKLQNSDNRDNDCSRKIRK